MNNAKMWLVVSPSVGVPVFLGAVAVGSFAVHVAVLSNTTWVSDFLSGQEMGAATAQVLPAAEQPSLAAIKEGERFSVTLPDGRVATAVIEPTIQLAESRVLK